MPITGRPRRGGTPPTVTSVTPVDGRLDTPVTLATRAFFDQSMNPSTFTGATMELRDNLSQLVAGAVSYDVALRRGQFTPNVNMLPGTAYSAKVKGGSSGVKNIGGKALQADYLWSFSTAAAAPPPTAFVGWGKNTTGGTGGTQHLNVSTYAAFKSALLASGPRIIFLTGNAVFQANNDSFSVQNDDVTIDGSGWTGQMMNFKISWRCNNVIIKEVAFRPGEGANLNESADRSALRILPSNNATITNYLIYRCSFAWGPDTILSILNNSENVTIQECLIGPSLFASNIQSSTNGYGSSITTSGTSASNYAKHITFYRNLLIMCEERNLRGQSGDWVEYIQNAVYDAGTKPATGNFQHASYMGNMFKKGPESNFINGPNFIWVGQLFGGVFNSFFPDSLYFPIAGDTADPTHINIGINKNGGLFTPDRSFGGSSKRTTPYASAPNLGATLVQATEAVYAQVVNGAGRTYQDNVDTLMKQHALAGTSDGRYGGVGFPAPHPFF